MNPEEQSRGVSTPLLRNLVTSQNLSGRQFRELSSSLGRLLRRGRPRRGAKEESL